MSQRLHLALKQLFFEPTKLCAAGGGVMVAVMLMWVQLSLLAAAYDSATVLHSNIQADFVVMHSLTETLQKLRPFSSRTLYRLRGDPDVIEIGELLLGNMDWRNPVTGASRQITCYAIDPSGSWLSLPGITENANALQYEDTFLFDKNSRNVFGPIIEQVRSGATPAIEIKRRTTHAVGLTEIASSFGQEGCMVTSRANFLRLNPGHPPEELHLGLVRVRSDCDREKLKKSFQQDLSPEALVMTPQEFKELELNYWKTNAPIGFIFQVGTAIGFFIGFIVVYQILFTDVSNHLPQFATMKAIGFSNRSLVLLIMRQGLYLAIMGYVLGSLLAIGAMYFLRTKTGIPICPSWARAEFLFRMTCLMCLFSSVFATRKLRAADPADVF